MRNSKLQQENEQHSLVCEQLSQENQQKALELKVNTSDISVPSHSLFHPPSIQAVVVGALGWITCMSIDTSEAGTSLQYYAQKQTIENFYSYLSQT